MNESKLLAEINGMAEEAKRLIEPYGMAVHERAQGAGPSVYCARAYVALEDAIDRLRDAAIAGVPDPAVHPAVPSLELHAAEAGSSSADPECICKGNWRLIVKEVEHLIDRKFVDRNGAEYTFFGLVHGSDDYHYGMSGEKLMLLSCVGSIEGHGYKEVTGRTSGAVQAAGAEKLDDQNPGSVNPAA